MIVEFGEENETVDLELERTIRASYQPSTTRIIGLAVYGNRLVYSDYDGILAAVQGSRQKLWAVTTVNSSIEASVPVVSDNNIAFSGLNELIIVTGNSGQPVFRRELVSGEQHIFGRRPVIHRSRIYYPTNSGFLILNSVTGEEIRRVDVPSGTRMTPLCTGSRIYIGNQDNLVFIYDLDGNSQGTITTAGERPIALSLTEQGGRAYYSDNYGHIVCLDLSGKKVLWEKDLSTDGPVPVLHDLIVTGSRILVYSSRGSLYVLNRSNGNIIFSSGNIFSAPPLAHEGYIYIGGEDGKLHVLAEENGETVRTIPLGEEPVSSRPVLYRSGIAVGTGDGWIYEINPLNRPPEIPED
jgi:outer membrane protein assembly factor BamB